MKVVKIAACLSMLSLAACMPIQEAPPTPMEIQSLQSREFEQSKDVVFASVMSVFQDLGYTIKSADKDTGFITAEGAAKSDFGARMLGFRQVSQTSATAFIETIGKVARVRLNFVASTKKSYENGQTDRNDDPILDAHVYNNAFERIDTAIFVRSAN